MKEWIRTHATQSSKISTPIEIQQGDFVHESNQPLPLETVETLKELGVVLKGIYLRMRSEGYDIIDDKIIHVSTGKIYEPKKCTYNPKQ
jgi:hypothetical protein